MKTLRYNLIKNLRVFTYYGKKTVNLLKCVAVFLFKENGRFRGKITRIIGHIFCVNDSHIGCCIYVNLCTVQKIVKAPAFTVVLKKGT